LRGVGEMKHVFDFIEESGSDILDLVRQSSRWGFLISDDDSFESLATELKSQHNQNAWSCCLAVLVKFCDELFPDLTKLCSDIVLSKFSSFNPEEIKSHDWIVWWHNYALFSTTSLHIECNFFSYFFFLKISFDSIL
jgi:hypothetical protein